MKTKRVKEDSHSQNHGKRAYDMTMNENWNTYMLKNSNTAAKYPHLKETKSAYLKNETNNSAMEKGTNVVWEKL